MDDSLLDDVKALLDKDFGDDRILKQILRACENNEVISNFERNYVRKLAEKYLGKTSLVKPIEIYQKEETIPDVIIPQTVNTQKIQAFQTHKPKILSRSKKRSKIMIGIGAIMLVAIIAIAATFGGSNNPVVTVDPIPPENVSLSIKSDLKSYVAKDIIAISGISETMGTVSLSIENQDGDIVWMEQVSIKSNNSYSTLAIAGGAGWEQSGTYLLIVDNEEETRTSTFSFTA